jgi:hypothetical protein|tara:strand:- start:254 stop:1441 length:1188 start_codon:yes stop_codon:yes gene_type:complete
MNKKKPNISSIALARERAVFKEAKILGFKSPLDDEDLRKSLHFQVAEEWYRMLVVKFDFVKYEDLKTDQVRLVQEDREHCENDLLPQFDLKSPHYGLKNPIIVRDDTGALQHGNHRAYVLFLISGKDDKVKIPTYRMSSTVYRSNSNGDVLEQSSISPEYLRHMARIKPNPPTRNKSYTMPDIALQFQQGFDLDPTLGGLITQGNLISKGVFNRWMDTEHPNQFTFPGTRGKIFKMIGTGKSVSVTRLPKFSDLTNMYIACGMPPGLVLSKNGKTQSRLHFLENYFNNNNYKIAVEKSDLGWDFERDIMVPLFKNYDLEQGSPTGAFEIEMLAWIAKPKGNKADLNAQRDTFLNRIKTLNADLNYHGRSVKFTTVRWMPQLKSEPSSTPTRVDSL